MVAVELLGVLLIAVLSGIVGAELELPLWLMSILNIVGSVLYVLIVKHYW